MNCARKFGLWLCLSLAASLLLGCAAAVDGIKRAVDDDPDLISINHQAQLAYESGEAAKAEALYKSIARRMPNDSETWLRLGNLYARNNRPDEAANAYQRALLADTSEARAWYNLGVVRLRQAWAALLQAQAQTPLTPNEALRAQTESTLEHLGKLPLLENETRQAPVAGDVGKY